MTKRTQQHRSFPKSPAGDSRVDCPKKFQRICAQGLAKGLGLRERLSFVERTAVERRFIWDLSGLAWARAKYDYPIRPLFQDEPRDYWLAVRLTTRLEQRVYYVESSSIIVFQGPPLQDKIPLLRAEWDEAEHDSRRDHAQPHWHIYNVSHTRSISTPFEPEPVPQDFTASQEPDTIPSVNQDVSLSLEKFHFAMMAQWHEGTKKIEPLVASTVPQWMERCVTYIRQQLIYINQ